MAHTTPTNTIADTGAGGQRPAPLVEHPELVTLLEPHPLTDEPGMHARYLSARVTGDVLVVAGDADRLDRLTAFVRDINGVTGVDYVHNDTSRSEDLPETELPPADSQYDTVVYTKEATAWFARARDFQRLTDRLAARGRLLSKAKWLPGSDRLRLDELAVAEPFGFESPHVYAGWTKTQLTLGGAVPDAGDETDGAAADADQESPGRRDLAADTRRFQTTFPDDERETEFTGGWSWHSALQAFVEEWTESVDGRVVNLCCGCNTQGDVRVDILREWTDREGAQQPTAATIQGDAMTAPFERNSVAAVVTDPPWKVPVETRVRLFSEAHRIVEPGGRILVNAWWLPIHPYAAMLETRAVTANVTDNSLAGPGGLSFLTEYKVLEQPGHPDRPYTLADHMDVHGVDHLEAHREWGWGLPTPAEVPANDPRVLAGSTACLKCECRSFSTRRVHGRPLYECIGCGFRWSAGELLAGVNGPKPPSGGDRTR